MNVLWDNKLLAVVLTAVMLLAGYRGAVESEYPKVTVNGFVETMESLNYRYSLYYNEGDMELLGGIYNNYSYMPSSYQPRSAEKTAYNYMVGQLKAMADDEEYADVTIFTKEDASDRNNILFRTDMAGESPNPINIPSDYRYIGI